MNQSLIFVIECIQRFKSAKSFSFKIQFKSKILYLPTQQPPLYAKIDIIQLGFPSNWLKEQK